MPIADPYEQALRDALVRAVPVQLARSRRRAVRRRAVFALVISLALIGTIVTVALPEDRADAQIDVVTRDGQVYARLLDLETRPGEIVAALANVGITATVETVPVGPSNVGRFLSAGGSMPANFRIMDGDRFSYRAFSVAADFRGELRITLGRPAADGEQWRGVSNAMAKDEVFSCHNIYGLTPVEATRALSGITASVRWMDARAGQDVAQGAELREPYASWRVIDAVSFGPGQAIILLTADGSWPYLTDKPKVDPNCKGS